MILAWYAFTVLAGACVMFTVAHVLGGWLFEREAGSRREWDGILANPPFGKTDPEPDRVAEMEAVAAAAWGRWSR